MTPRQFGIDGETLFYYYLKDDDEFSRQVQKRFIIDLSVWLPRNFYERLPVFLPFVVRDPSCRPRGKDGKEEWGTADQNGFFRDDNTLVKGIVRSLEVRGKRLGLFEGQKLVRGFRASHIWSKVNIQGNYSPSTRNYMLNSFVPNLVWLPTQISILTDRQGSFAQRLVQWISHQIYRDIPMPEPISNLWEFLPCPAGPSDLQIDIENLNYFDVPDRWLEKKVTRLRKEMDQIISIDRTGILLPKVRCRRYLPSCRRISSEKRKGLSGWLKAYSGLLGENHLGTEASTSLQG